MSKDAIQIYIILLIAVIIILLAIYIWFRDDDNVDSQHGLCCGEKDYPAPISQKCASKYVFSPDTCL